MVGTLFGLLKRLYLSMFLLAAMACSGSSTTTAPTPAPAPSVIPRPTSTFHLTGIATEDDGNPVVGATVTVQPWVYAPTTTVPSVSGMTDGRGFYIIDFDANRDAVGGVGWVWVESAGHDPSYYYVIPASASQNATQNLHLYRIKRITASESTLLTVLPGDTMCGDNDQFFCRTMHVVASTDGLMTIEAVPTPSASNAGLEIMGRGGSGYRCCSLTTSIPVTAGTEVTANVGAWWTSTTSQSFMFNTSLVRP
jgi:hypothetical protein